NRVEYLGLAQGYFLRADDVELQIGLLARWIKRREVLHVDREPAPGRGVEPALAFVGNDVGGDRGVDVVGDYARDLVLIGGVPIRPKQLDVDEIRVRRCWHRVASAGWSLIQRRTRRRLLQRDSETFFARGLRVDLHRLRALAHNDQRHRLVDKQVTV